MVPEGDARGGEPGGGEQAAGPRGGAAVAPERGLLAYHRQTRAAFSGFLMGAPLALAYNLSLMVAGGDPGSGGDFFVRWQVDLLGPTGYRVAQLSLLAAFLVVVALLARRDRFRPAYYAPLLLEAGAHAAVALAAVRFAPLVAGAPASRPPPPPPGAVLPAALGEAINQETFFRWILLEAAIWLLHRRLRLPAAVAAPAALALGAGIYASFGAFLGEPPPPGATAGRLAALAALGIWFGAVYLARGYAAAAYAHALFALFWRGVAPYVGL